MIILKSYCVQVSGKVADTYLSGLKHEDFYISVKNRQDFELRVAQPIEFENVEAALKFLDNHFSDRKHYVFDEQRILASNLQEPKNLFEIYVIEWC